MRRHLTPSLVISVVALFVAMGGTGYAVSKLPKNSVGSAQLKKNAVTSAKVKDRSLLAKDFKKGQLPAGEKGATGEAGAPGAAGSALAYAYVSEAGYPDNLIPPASAKNIDSSMVTRVATGVYCFDLESIWPVHSVSATAEPLYGDIGESDRYVTAQILHNDNFGLGCPNTSDMVAIVRDQSANAAVDWFFYVTIN